MGLARSDARAFAGLTIADIAPVHSGKRIRGRFTLAEAQTRGRGDLMTRFAATVEIEGADRPAVKADWLVLYQF